MAGKIVTVAQQKGGAGKTTLVAHLAVAWAEEGRRVALVDIDPQGSLSQWFAEREKGGAPGLTHSRITGWRTQVEVERLARDHDMVVLDSPPHAETESRIAVRAASLLVVPVQPSPMDLWATRPTLDLAKAERVPAILVLNRVPPRAKLTEELAAKIGELGVPVARTQIGNRTAYPASMLAGRTVQETARRTRAAEEVAELAAELAGQL
ncbi:MAG TPA: ParA family partition ATPase [Alphaproteobacteria bacterium]|nr:ParA family partition ATPase [Alphaproteobacteria bacterium]